MRIYLARHGETEENKLSIIQGQSGGKLSEDGILQAVDLGKSLQDIKIHRAFVSDLNRTKHTFTLLNNELSSKIEDVSFTGVLREINTGELTGQPMASWSLKVKETNSAPRQFRPQGGETFEDVFQRAKQFYEELQDVYKTENGAGLTVLVVSHGGFIREFYNYVNFASTNLMLESFPHVGNCSLHLFEIDESLEIKSIQHINKLA